MPLFWFDGETTGLDPVDDCILEVGWGYTGNDYRPIAQGSEREVSDGVYQLLIRPTQEIIDKIKANEYVHNMHGESGLLEDLEKALRGEIPSVPLSGAESLIVAEMKTAQRRDPEWSDRIKWIITGRSVRFDREFIQAHMPLLFSQLGHRIHDVSNFTHFFEHRVGLPQQGHRPLVPHRADQDIAADMTEMRAYGDLIVEAFDALREKRLSRGLSIEDLPPLTEHLVNTLTEEAVPA